MFTQQLPSRANISLKRLMLLSVSMSVFMTPNYAVAEEQRPSAEDNIGLGDIIVTANRRAESGQDVPISITTLSPTRLEQQGIAKEQDLQASVPSLVVGTNGNGSREAQSFTIRGQGATFQASPGVVVYMNEVPLASAVTISQQGGPGNFVDLDSLQVLSGPQGTLFGRNATGGAVLLTAKKPNDEFGGWFKAETGNYKRAYLEGAVNIPLVEDKFLVRAVAAYHSRKGFTEDVIWNKFRDNEDWYYVRLSAIIRPSQRIENYTIVSFGESDTTGAGLIHRGFNIGGLQNIGFCTDSSPEIGGIAVPCDVYRQATIDADQLGPRKTAMSTDVFQQTNNLSISNSTEIEFSDYVKLRNIVSYQRMQIGYRYDGDATVLQHHDVDPGRLPSPNTAFMPLLNYPIEYNNSTLDWERPRDNFEQITEELQLQGNSFDDALEWTIGAFYFKQQPKGEQGARALLYCPALYTGNCEASYNIYGNSTTSKALYAQGTVNIGALANSLDGLRFTVGYRYTWDHVSGFASQWSRDSLDQTKATCSGNGSTVDFATAYDDCYFDASLKTKTPTWTAGIDYRINQDLMLFAKVSRGFKAGGFNSFAVRPNTRTFLPEYVTSYEAGGKSDFLVGDVPVRFNLSAYTLKYEGIQRAVGDYNSETNASGSRVFNADARINGIELEASARPFKGLTVGGNFSLTDAKYTKFEADAPLGGLGCDGPVAPGGVLDMSCIKLAYVAKYIWSANASYEIPLAGGAGDLSFFANYSHTSKQHTEAAMLSSLQPGSVLEPFGTLNASIDWRRVGGSGWDLGIFGTNITNKLYRIGNTNVYPEGSLLYWSTMYGEPRMYGLRATLRFGSDKR